MMVMLEAEQMRQKRVRRMVPMLVLPRARWPRVAAASLSVFSSYGLSVMTATRGL
jgi:hypothetical protein